MKKWKARVAWGAILTLFIAVSGGVMLQIIHSKKEDTAQNESYQREAKEFATTVGEIATRASSARTKEDWADVKSRAVALPEQFAESKTYYALLSDVRTIELLAERHDKLLSNASELFAVNENDPEVKVRLAEAKQLQEEIAKMLKRVSSRQKDPEWNLALAYRKGYEDYRSLAFVDKKAHTEALDIIAGAVAHFRKGLLAVEKDNRTERAIEFLYKRAKQEEEESGKKNPGPGRPRALPTPGTQEPGTGGEDRLRRH